MQAYHQLLQRILDERVRRDDVVRTGILSVVDRRTRFDSDGEA